MTNKEGVRRLPMVKQKSSYLSDFECDSDDQVESSIRETFEMDHFVKNVDLNYGRTAATPENNESQDELLGAAASHQNRA